MTTAVVPTRTEMRDALRLVLMFHAGGEWGELRREQWKSITGTYEATSKVMCDHIRRVLDGHICKAQRTADPPQDCNWPMCGCDPEANDVFEALVESGLTIVPEEVEKSARALADHVRPHTQKHITEVNLIKAVDQMPLVANTEIPT